MYNSTSVPNIILGGIMQINLSELLSNEGKTIEVTAFYEPEAYETKTGTYPILEKKPMVFQFTNLGKKRILMNTVIEMALLMPCDRCLELVRQDFHIEVTREFNMEETEAHRIDALDETNFISGNSLDVDKLVYGEILLELPMKILCSESCKGICNRCGTNLNHGTCDCDTRLLDPRMAKVLDIFKNS